MTRLLSVAIVGIVAAAALAADIGHERPLLFRDAFDGPDGIITNQHAYFAPSYEEQHESPNWEMESGCALRDGNRMWTGKPTQAVPNSECSNGTGSATFRLWTKRADFDDVAVSFSLQNNGYTTEGETWDGVKIYLRRQDGDNFYTAEVNRREGNVIVQRKCDGRYKLLGGTRTAATAARIGEPEYVAGTAVNLDDDQVRIQVVRGDAVVLEAVDPGGTCDALREPGRIGIRGDRTDFYADSLEVRGVGPG